MRIHRPLQSLLRQSRIVALAAVLLATGVTEGLYRSGAAERLEHLYADIWHRLAGQRHVPIHAALVMIDDPSLNARPDEPLAFWTPHLAQALATLREVGVKLVAIDFIFSSSPERWIAKMGLQANEASRNLDQPFRAAINAGYVELAAFKVGAGETADDFVLPNPDYLLALPDMDMVRGIGLANLRADSDGTVRRFGLLEASSDYARREGLPLLAFGPLAAIRASGQDTRAATSDGKFTFSGRAWPPATELRISYAGPPGTFSAISFETLLQPDATKRLEIQALAGKVVILGAGYAGTGDAHPTPYSTSLGGKNRLMTGAEIQANIVETLLGGHWLEPVSGLPRLTTFLALFGMLAFIGIRLTPLGSVLLVMGAVLFSAASTYLLFKQNLLFPVAHLHIGMAVVLGGLTLLRLTHEEREKARIGAMFSRYVSPRVVTALINATEPPELGGKAAAITVLFSDIRGFTTISEKLAAHEVVELLNSYFERACAALLAEDATIDKFIGDAIMAEFGAPLPQADHAARAVRAALALRQVATDFRGWMDDRFPERNLPRFDIGIGLHSGEAVVGNIGSSTRMEYTAIGDVVNVASRLEGMTKETGCAILASQATVKACGPNIRTGARYSLQVKGRGQPVEAYELLHDTN
ncbi:MAG: adenylate/guanylate cyclase domain-containing protein [Rhodocyclaceae bacterium]|nr:adenylate/guanylate cyclase domain-containing protein [Rhodocyclaceae bacterium]